MITWVTSLLTASVPGGGVNWASWANSLGYGLIMTALFIWNRLDFTRALTAERMRHAEEMKRLDDALRTTREDIYPRLKALEDKK